MTARTALLIALVVAAASGRPSAQEFQLTPSVPSGQTVGTPIVWTATGAPAPDGLHQFSIARNGGAALVVRDFSRPASFSWTPTEEGTFVIRVLWKPAYGTTAQAMTAATFEIRSRVVGDQPVVTPTAHPLVAFYSAAPCAAGWMYVEFGPAGGALWQRTAPRPCRPGQSMNFLIAGMRPATPQVMRHVVVDGTTTVRGPMLEFTPGTPQREFAAMTVADPHDAATSVEDGVVLVSPLNPLGPARNFPFATDLGGRLLWYFDGAVPSTGYLAYVTRPVAGGTLLMLAQCCDGEHYVWEINLAGNILRETNLFRINEQLAARGDEQIEQLHHEVTRMPNGQTLLLGMLRRDGPPGQPPTLGDVIVALDANWQVAWSWNAFEHLDTRRPAVLGETCLQAYGPLCDPEIPDARDWLHSNAITYSPADGNLLLSIRHQDWVVKIDYRNGAGTGTVLWRLGLGGDFTIDSADPYPWFSHQHDAHYAAPGIIAVFDNGNTRCAASGPPCVSRGQVYRVDEANRRATMLVNAPLETYFERLGSAERLSNGNFQFGAGDLTLAVAGASIEVTPAGSQTYRLTTSESIYRTFRMKTLFTP